MDNIHSITVDSAGKPTGFYHTEIHGDNIPASGITISDDDYRAFINEPGKWLWKNGKRIAAPVMAPTPDQVIKGLEGIIRRHLDTIAKEKSYDGILSLCSYATSTNEVYAAEGKAGVVWRDAVYGKFIEVSAAITAGGPAPTEKELIAMLPAIIWP